MTASIDPVLVLDDRLKFESGAHDFAVFQSGANVSQMRYNSQSLNSLTNQTFVLQLPSEVTVIDKEILLDMTCTFRMVCTSVAQVASITTVSALWGEDTGFCPFPLNFGIIQQSQLSLNNNSTTLFNNFLMPYLINALNSEANNYFLGGTVTYPDPYLYYSDGRQANNNPLGSYVNVPVHGGKTQQKPRGTYQIINISTSAVTAGDYDYAPIYQNAASTAFNVDIKVRFIEKVMVSPLMFSECEGVSKGMYGITNMQLILTLNSGASVIRSLRKNPNGTPFGGYTAFPNSVSLKEIHASQLILTLLTPKPTQLLSSMNSHPYMNFVPYLTTQNAPALPPASNNNVGVPFSVTTNSVQLNAIPDKLIIYVPTVPYGQKTMFDTDSYYVIEGVSIVFNNQVGILSQATQYNLWEMSATTTAQTWEQFSGRAMAKADPANASPVLVKTSGSILALNFGEHIPIAESYLAPGSLGAFNLLVTLQLRSLLNTNKSNAPTSVDVVMITQNSGVCAFQNGTTLYSIGPLSRSAVLEVQDKQSEPIFRSDLRAVGAGMSGGAGLFSAVKSFLGPLAKSAVKALASRTREGFEKRGSEGSMVDKGIAEAMKSIGLGKKMK
jgi:hypothetical protein